MVSTGLSSNPTEYRKRLGQQPDDQLDAWTKDLLRDAVRRRGVVTVVADFGRSTRMDENGLKRVFARGGGAPEMAGHDPDGHLVVPTIALHYLVDGLRAEVPDARARLIDYLVAKFDEIVYV